MTQPISEQIIDNIVTVLLEITGSGWNQTVYEVKRATAASKVTVTTFPGCQVFLIDEEKTDEENVGHRDVHMTVEIWAYVVNVDNTDQELGELAADIEKKLMEDHTRGALAVDTDIESIEHELYSDKERPTGVAIITLDINFRHRRDNPFSQ